MKAQQDLPWNQLFPLSPLGVPGRYGYVKGGRVVFCSREELMDHDQLPALSMVLWDSDDGEPVSVFAIPELRRQMARRILVHADQRRGWSILWTLIGLGLTILLLWLQLPWWIGWAPVCLGVVVSIREIWVAESKLPRIAENLRDDGAWQEELEPQSEDESETQRMLFWAWIQGQKNRAAYWMVAPNIAVFLATGFPLQFDDTDTAPVELSKGPLLLEEPWRLLTTCFAHAGVLHIWLNMVALASVLRLLVPVTSIRFALSCYVVCGLGGSLGSILWIDATSVGSSGAIFGLFGAVLGVHGWNLALRELRLVRAMAKGVAVMLGLGFLLFFIIDNGAHVAGLLTGLVLVPLCYRRAPIVPASERESAALLLWPGAVLFFVAAAFSIARVWFEVFA